MKDVDEVKILGVDVARTDVQWEFKKKEFEDMILESFDLKLYQKIYLKILMKTNGLITRVYKRRSR